LQLLAAERGDAPFRIINIPYPGFEGRPRASSFDAFLDEVCSALEFAALESDDAPLIYATGIGGLFALALRSRGHLRELPILLQAPVLWGLERRTMPRLMRLRVARSLILPLFALSPFQAAFRRRYLLRKPSVAFRDEFFAGYANCTAVADLFAWCDPQLLRRLEARFATRPEALQHISVWWGQHDRVLSLQELKWTELALEHKWPLTLFAEWGHYPMIDDPGGWVKALGEFDYE
jgi:hypothetical protein